MTWKKWKQRIFYGATDMGGNLIWQMVGLYLLFYYTTVLNISAAFVGTLFLVVRFIDAFDGMFFGYLIDHTKSKYGKSRPYFLWFGVPLGILAMLLFINPSFGGNDLFQKIWVSVIYTLFSLVYSGANTPITAILPSLTKNKEERANLASARMVMTNIGTTVIAAITLPIINMLGGQNSETAWMIWGIIIGSVIMLLFFSAFISLREQPLEESDNEADQIEGHLSIKESFKGAFKNRPWVILSISLILIQTFWVTRMSATVFYVTYVYDAKKVFSLLMAFTITSVIGNLLVPILAKKFSNRSIMTGILIAFIIGQVISPLGVNSGNVVWLFAGNIISMITMGGVFTLSFVMIADTVEYSRVVQKIEEPGFLSSIPMVGAKIGMGVGGAVSGWVLAWGGFSANATVQSAKALSAISINFIWIPVLLSIVVITMMRFYNLDEKQLSVQDTDKAEANVLEDASIEEV